MPGSRVTRSWKGWNQRRRERKRRLKSRPRLQANSPVYGISINYLSALGPVLPLSSTAFSAKQGRTDRCRPHSEEIGAKECYAMMHTTHGEEHACRLGLLLRHEVVYPAKKGGLEARPTEELEEKGWACPTHLHGLAPRTWTKKPTAD